MEKIKAIIEFTKKAEILSFIAKIPSPLFVNSPAENLRKKETGSEIRRSHKAACK